MASALLFVLVLLQGQPVSANGLLNSDFEAELIHGFIGDPTNATLADSAFWVGGETLTVGPTGGRFLRLDAAGTGENAFVYQRVGAAPEKGTTATISARVRVQATGDEARIVFSEANGEYWSLDWVLAETPYYRPGDFENGALKRWEVWEYVNGPDPQQLTYQAGGKNARFDGSSIDNVVRRDWWELSSGSAGYLEVRWIAPKAGTIRALARPYHFQGVDNDERNIDCTIFHVTGAGTQTPLETRASNKLDVNGPQIAARVDVEENDEIWFRILKTWPQLPQQPGHLYGVDPVVAYEGLEYTYRIGSGLLPDATVAGEIIDIPPAQLGTWVDLIDLPAGQSHHLAHCGMFCSEETRPPFDIKLAATVGEVDFDDVECSLEWESATEADLRSNVLAEARWARENVLGVDPRDGVLDRPNLDNPNKGEQRGTLATPYRAHTLKIISGPEFIPGSDPKKREQDDAPDGLWDLLNQQYYEYQAPTLGVDYDDFFWIREQEMHRSNLSSIENDTYRLVHHKHDIFSDKFLKDNYTAFSVNCSLYHPGIVVAPRQRMLLEWYQRTNDLNYLDRAYELGDVMIQFGQITDSVPTGKLDRSKLIAWKGYDINTGEVTVSLDELFGPHGPKGVQGGNYNSIDILNATGPCVEAYARARIYNHTSGSSRYDPTRLTTWLTNLDEAVTASIPFRAHKNIDNGGDWSWTRWQYFPGVFNDVWGNQGTDALHAYLAMQELEDVQGPLQGLEAAIRDNFLNEWILDGTAHHVSIWEQAIARGAFTPGDFVRGVDVYVEDIRRGIGPQAIRDEAEQLIIATAKHCVRFQVPATLSLGDPVWVSGGLGAYQFADIASRQAGAAAGYPWIVAYALEMPSLSAADRDYLLAVLDCMLETNRGHFRADALGSNPGSGDGWGYYLNFLIDGIDRDLNQIELRSLFGFLRGLESLGDAQYEADVPAPVCSISPESLDQSVAEAYTFTLTFDPSVTPTERQDALLNRTRVYAWEFGSGSEYPDAWVRSLVWDGTQTGWTIDNTSQPNAISITSPTNTPLPPSGEYIKHEVVSWDSDGRWNRDTSLQETP